MRAQPENALSVCEAAVIAAYSAARAQGRTRYEAFVRAVQAYREQCPDDLQASGAGPEVARILLATVRSGEDAGSAGLQTAKGMEYVEST
jgi:hypothetical protein